MDRSISVQRQEMSSVRPAGLPHAAVEAAVREDVGSEPQPAAESAITVDQRKAMLVISSEPLLHRFRESFGEDSPPRIIFPIALIMAYLGPDITPPEDVCKEIRLITDMWHARVERMTTNEL
jgi:hypothetical protein